MLQGLSCFSQEQTNQRECLQQGDALTDGLLTLRYLFGLQGDTLINGVVAEDATRKTAEEIEAHLETLMPAL